MIAETERLNRVIGQLIEFARPLELRKEPTDAADLVRQTLRLIAAEAKDKSVEVDVQAKEDLPRVPVDPDKIKQVLLNILLNALAAMPAGGRLSVDLALQNNCLAVTVSDTGEGISGENLPRIYDPYFTSKPAGTGLGLAIVQKIMEAHGGTVRVESRAHKGTTVTLRFGLTDDERNVT
jgi:two-component system sensor histidine kinase HydH